MYWLKEEAGRVDLHLVALEVFQLHIVPIGRLKLYRQSEARATGAFLGLRDSGNFAWQCQGMQKCYGTF